MWFHRRSPRPVRTHPSSGPNRPEVSLLAGGEPEGGTALRVRTAAPRDQVDSRIGDLATQRIERAQAVGTVTQRNDELPASMQPAAPHPATLLDGAMPVRLPVDRDEAERRDAPAPSQSDGALHILKADDGAAAHAASIPVQQRPEPDRAARLPDPRDPATTAGKHSPPKAGPSNSPAPSTGAPGGATATGDAPPAAPGAAAEAAAPADAQGAPRIVLPERPRLSSKITLKGQMKESGFKKEPWLADRGGGYIQLTELLYRIAEHSDGRNTVDQIADAVSERYGKRVSADNVRQLLAQKLIPLGVIANGDGQEFGRGGSTRGALSVNFKMAMIDPRYISPFTAVLRWLYWPPVLVAVLLAGAVAEWWLFTRHGLGGSVREALYAPGMLLAALGLIVLAAAFHELGHAAALRYGGGEVRGMGAGLYLVYPAFYTDVSDNYRLGRWAKVRTDLGGFYFNIVFALGLMALYAATGFELLLIAVVLINFDIIRQSMPFVRLDGYWALADVTGVPDFFTNIGAFLRSILPLPFWQGRKLPELKTWVRIVFALYLLVTIPLLVLLLFATIRSVPRILATAWDSGKGLGGEFSAAQGAGDLLGMLSAAVQILTLALPTLGVLYMVFALAKGISRFVWNWSRGSAPKRVAGVSGLGVLAALVALLWLPQVTALLPGPAGRSGPLYRQSAWRPIQPGERGTVGDAVRDVPVAGVVVSRFSPPSDTLPASATPAGQTAATPSATATARAEETGTPAASATAGASPVAGLGGRSPSVSPSAAPVGAVELRTSTGATLRSGPGTTFAPLASLPAGTALTGTGRTADSAWVRVQSAAGAGWVAADLLQSVRGTIASLPVDTTAGAATAAASATAPLRAATNTATATQTGGTATPTRTPTPVSGSAARP